VEALVYIANMLYLASYFMQDILRLRALTITAATCLAGYFYLQPEPHMTVVCWNLFFVALNVVQIARLLAARRRVQATCRRGSGHVRSSRVTSRRASMPMPET
jgi:hypothetical protein